VGRDLGLRRMDAMRYDLGSRMKHSGNENGGQSPQWRSESVMTRSNIQILILVSVVNRI